MTRRNSSMYEEDYSGDFGQDEAAESDQIDLQHYIRLLRKHKWPIVLFTAIITGLAGYYAFTATPIYSATSTLLIEPQGQNVVSIDELVGFDTQSKDYYETQFELLRSRGLAYRVVSSLNLWQHSEYQSSTEASGSDANGQAASESSDFIGGLVDDTASLLGLNKSSDDSLATVVVDIENPNAGVQANDASITDASGKIDNNVFNGLNTRGNKLPDFALEIDADTLAKLTGANDLTRDEQVVLGSFMGRVSIAPVRKTKLVKIGFESADPVLAARVANAIGEQYILSHLDAKLELTTKASSWLNERLASLKGTLDESEQRLIGFKQANGLVDVDGSVGRLNEQELLLTTAELAQARSEVAAQRSLYNDVQTLKDQPELLQSIPSIQADALVQATKIDQGQAQRQLDELMNRYGERHPRVVDANSQLVTISSTLEGHMARVVGSISKDYQLAQQRLVSIEAKLATGKQEIQVIGTKKFELDSLEREVNTNRGIYDTYFSRITEAKSADGLESANARVSDYAIAPLTPVKPKKQLIIALAALASLVLSMLMAILYEQLDDTVKGTADIEDTLGLKLLGILPLIKAGFLKTANRLPLHPEEIPDKKGTFAESVNTIRTALAVDDTEDTRKIFVVTSSVPGEGKSTTSVNLAFSMARLERVLLIDCDLRRPTVAKAAGLEKNAVGLTNLITQTAPARDCIKSGLFSVSLDIMPSGPIPAQPLELLSSKRFKNILKELTKHYDRIVIDCAPTQAVSDALVLGKLSDGVVYAIKSHETSLDLVKRGVQRLRQAKVPIAGVVVTQVDIDRITSYGGDYYYQGYYDYYGYTEKGDKSEVSTRKSNRMQLSQKEIIELKQDDSDVELDLDVDYHGHTRRNGEAVDKVSRFENFDEEDFDATSRIDMHDNGRREPVLSDSRQGAAASSRERSSRKSINDDLDII